MSEYQIQDNGDKRALIVGNKTYETVYSKKIIELIIKRKGLKKTPEYFRHKDKRSYYLSPLFDYLKSAGLKNLKVLEVGCSAGQATELLNEEFSIAEIYSYDVDKILVEVVKLKAEELGLKKVKSVDCFSSRETLNLPYQNNFFDVIILSGVVEHLPLENRHMFVDEYYRKLKLGGLICFLDTPNRNFPFEAHSIGLPFISKLSPQTAFIYAKMFGKLKGSDFADFVRAGTAWRNATYYECLPKALAMEVEDISEDAGYGYKFFKKTGKGIKFKFFLLPAFAVIKLLSVWFEFPMSFFLPNMNVVLRKEINYEKE